MTHPDVYFVANLFDEIRFDTYGWDSILRQYQSYYPDNIFRLRTSQFCLRNYTDYWQCGFAPDSSAFYTRRWLELGEDWNPCLGPDSFQQCVAFYMYTYDPFSPRQFCRDIPVRDIRFSGEGASVGLEGEALEKRRRQNIRAWFILMSHRMQEEASRRAGRLIAHIISNENGGQARNEIIEDDVKKVIIVRNRKTDVIVEAVPYHLSWIRITATNIWRGAFEHYYCGGGRAVLSQSKFTGIRMIIETYSGAGAKLLRFSDRLRLGFRGSIKRTIRSAYHSETLRQRFWFMRKPYRVFLRLRGL
jgi:hypothetical protein